MTEPMKTEQLKTEINHIIDSGVNDIRLTELFERYAAQQVAAERERIKKEIYKVFGDSVVEEWSSSRIRKEILEKLIDNL